ncbi:MAG: VCBS repeat-containing protein [Rhodoferax sp.]
MKVFQSLFAGGMVAAALAACGGGGSGSTSSVVQPPVKSTPIAVQRSSYENKIAAGKALGPITMPPKYGDAAAFADFMQNGTYSVVTHTLEYDVNKPVGVATPGHIYFYQYVNGVWQDKTSQLLSSNVGCIHPRKAIVADFNGDGKPDVFFACHGFDAAPFSGEQQRVLLSQADGTYKHVALPIVAYGHGGSAADVNANGYADIVVTDTSVAGQPIYLVNNKDGTFTKDLDRVPQAVKKFPCFTGSMCTYGIYSTEFIDFNKDGKYDLWIGGAIHPADIGNIDSEIFINPGSNIFTSVAPKVIQTSLTDGGTLDVVFENNNIYQLYTLNYGGVKIEKIDYATNTATTIYTHTGPFSNGSNWFPWIIPYNNTIRAMNPIYPVSVPF